MNNILISLVLTLISSPSLIWINHQITNINSNFFAREELQIVQAEEVRRFITEQYINPDMGKFTFHRIIGSPAQSDDYFSRYPVSIRIYDENNNLIQEISGLYQSTSPFNHLDHDWMQLSFTDLNFDGYMDMRLFSYILSERGNIQGEHYHWLWDSEIGQFVFNEQLTRSISNTVILTDEETETWSIGWSWQAGRGHMRVHYRYIDGEFIIVRREEWNLVRIHESHEFDDMLRIHVDSSDLPDYAEGGEPRIKHIGIYADRESSLIQEIRDIRTNLYSAAFHAPPPTPQAKHRFEIFALHFADYNNDGYLDMALATWAGGSLQNSPRMYWLWCTEQHIFVRNEFLERLSDESTVSTTEDGMIVSMSFEGSGQWNRMYFRYESGNFVRVYKYD